MVDVGTESATAGPSLEDFAASVFGGPGSDNSPAEGAPTAAASVPAGIADPVEPTTAITADPGQSPPAGTSATDPALDPQAVLDGYQPLTYQVDGAERSFDGIHVHPEFGAVVDATAVPALIDRLSKYEHFQTANQQLYQRQQEADKLTTWQTVNEQGQPTTLTGRDGAEASRVAYARAIEERNTLATALKGVSEALEAAAPGQTVLDHAAIQHIIRDAKLAASEIEKDVRSRFAKEFGAPGASAQPAAFQPAQLAEGAVQLAIRETNTTGLQPADIQYLAKLAPRYIHPATPQDVQWAAQNGGALRVGEPVIEREFHELVKLRAQERSQTASTINTAGQATAANVARLKAAHLAGKGPARTVSASPANTTTTKTAVPPGVSAFDLQHALSSGKMPDLRVRSQE